MPDKYFVIDTNVLVSAVVFFSKKPEQAIAICLHLGTVALSKEIESEYRGTLSENKFDKYLPVIDRERWLNSFVKECRHAEPAQSVKICRDPDDDKFLSLALALGAACIITGDPDLLTLHPFQNIPILKPADFIRWIVEGGIPL